MGSFTSKVTVSGGDIQDNDLQIPPNLSHAQLLAWVQRPLAELPKLLQRKYRLAPLIPGRNSRESSETFRIMTWNILAQGMIIHFSIRKKYYF